MGDSSQKIWTYFTESEPVTLAVGQKLTASISFIPRKVLAEVDLAQPPHRTLSRPDQSARRGWT